MSLLDYLPFKRFFRGLDGRWFPDTNFPLFDIDKLKEITHDDERTMFIVFTEILRHEWWHQSTFTNLSGTSYNTLRLAEDEVNLVYSFLEQSHAEKKREIKAELIECEIASDEMFQRTKNVMEALNAYILYGEEQILSRAETNEPIENLSIRLLENTLNRGKVSVEDLEILMNVKKKFRELILSDTKAAEIYDRLRSLKEASSCNALPIIVCSMALDHPFFLHPKHQ